MRTSVPLFVISVFALLLVGCDATGPSDTVILNSSSPIPPTVEYTFDYDTNGNSQIGVRSDQTDDLDSTLAENGFSRRSVVTARVESVELERLSSKTAAPSQKVFDYLTGATVYLGSDASGSRIAEEAFEATDPSVPLQVVGADVTDVVKSGATPAFLQLDTDGNVPDRRDRVRVTVQFRIEMRGV